MKFMIFLIVGSLLKNKQIKKYNTMLTIRL